MAVYALGDLEPTIHPEAFIHPDAVIIGAVSIGAHSSVWPSAVLRGDDGEIRVGERSSIQDGSVLHTTPDDPTVVGNECVIGHLVHLEGCTIEDRALVGNMAMVLHRSVIGTGAVVGANSVVLYDVDVPPGALAVGSPAVIKPDKARLDDILAGVETYVARARRFRDELRRID
ncbi:MAG: gamma carbonic anhydrase family protein [Ilumatobacteraceae bacterium]